MKAPKLRKARLLIDVDAEGVHIPAGTIVEIEHYYPPDESVPFGCYDLVAGGWANGVLFWANESEVEVQPGPEPIPLA